MEYSGFYELYGYTELNSLVMTNIAMGRFTIFGTTHELSSFSLANCYINYQRVDTIKSHKNQHVPMVFHSGMVEIC